MKAAMFKTGLINSKDLNGFIFRISRKESLYEYVVDKLENEEFEELDEIASQALDCIGFDGEIAADSERYLKQTKDAIYIVLLNEEVEESLAYFIMDMIIEQTSKNPKLFKEIGNPLDEGIEDEIYEDDIYEDDIYEGEPPEDIKEIINYYKCNHLCELLSFRNLRGQAFKHPLGYYIIETPELLDDFFPAYNLSSKDSLELFIPNLEKIMKTL